MSRPVPESILPWAMSVLGVPGGCPLPALQTVSGDASARRYFRFEFDARSHVLVDAPPATEKNREFLAIRDVLAAAGVCVPDLLGADLEQGYLLLEDLGDQLLLGLLNEASVEGHYRKAFDVLFRFAQVQESDAALPAYDQALLREELGRFPEWFVEGLLGYRLSEGERALLRAVDALLVQSALEQPRVLVHRDFHSRNLMLSGTGELAVIDFQDAVHGPVTYDLVSLLRDCYIRWPAPRVRQWACDYRHQLDAAGLLPGVTEAQFLRWFDWMGLQRHLKVLGTFARLYLRDGKAAYLNDLPLVLRYVQEVLGDYADTEPVLADFSAWFAQALLPIITRQDWSQSA